MRRTIRILAVFVTAAALTVIGGPATAGRSEPPGKVLFWEDVHFVGDGVELGPAPASITLTAVTRDCVIVCIADWNNLASSFKLAPNTTMTVYTQDDTRCTRFVAGATGLDVADLTRERAGMPAGHSWNDRIFRIALNAAGTDLPHCAAGVPVADCGDALTAITPDPIFQQARVNGITAGDPFRRTLTTDHTGAAVYGYNGRDSARRINAMVPATDRVRLTWDGLGRINDGGWPTSTAWSPDGDGHGNHTAMGKWISRDRRIVGPEFRIGRGGCFTAPGTHQDQPVYLYMWMSDPDPGNNRGSWTFTVEQFIDL